MDFKGLILACWHWGLAKACWPFGISRDWGGFVGLIEIDAAGGGLDTLTRFSLVTGWLLKKAPGELYGVGLSESVGYIFSR